MNTSIINCRLCHSTDTQCFLTLDSVPHDVLRMLKESEIATNQAITLRAYLCNCCGLVQLPQNLDDEHYDDSYWSGSHIRAMVAHQSSQAETFVKKFKLQGKRVVDIGCGDGNYLEYIRSAGAIPFGVEPARSPAAIAQAKIGINSIHIAYVTGETPVPDGPYDAFTTRQVLEHIPDLNDFLIGIRRSLTANAVGLIEVPNLEQSLSGQRFYDFFTEHLNYFTENTLRFALEKNGLKVMEIVRSMNNEYLEATVMIAEPLTLPTLQKSSDSLLTSLRKLLSENKSKGLKTAVWGAGIKGVTTLALLKSADIEYVIDSAPDKRNLYTPVSNLRVIHPEDISSQPVDVIIISAVMYLDEIVNQIRSTPLLFCGDIYYFGSGAVLSIGQNRATVTNVNNNI
jgi:2-polyprenyl-3-methyl-5-hydroxy-6-metoxy-1,4-benzoquinol methylase